MKLYLHFAAMHLKSRMAYRRSFFLYLIGQFLGAFASFAVLCFLLDRFGDINGYTLPECLLCASVVWMAFSLAECFFRGFDCFPRLVRRAEFDRMLVRPRRLVFQVLCQEMELLAGAACTAALVALLRCMARGSAQVSVGRFVV